MATTALRRLRGTVVLSVLWGAAWAVAGLAIGVTSLLLPTLPWHVLFDVFDAPLPALGVPGAVGGALFSVVLQVAARHRRFEDLTLPRFTALGALGGVLLSVVPEALVAAGLATLGRPGLITWGFVLAKGAVLGLLGAASAAATLVLAQRGRDHASPRQSGDVRHLAASRPVASERSRSATSRPGTP